MNTTQYKGLNLPAPGTRINEGLNDNEAYLQSGVEQISHMIEMGIMSNDSTILDFGCGQGRLANALKFIGYDIDDNILLGHGLHECRKNGLNVPGFIEDLIDYYDYKVVRAAMEKRLNYINYAISQMDINSFNSDIIKGVKYYGIDTDCKVIQWCKDNINFGHFLCKESKNKRYNPKAPQLEGIPNDDNFFDLIFLNSVFSHMLQGDVSFYLDEFYRVLKPGGHVYLTGFIEINVPPVEENPRGYMGMSGNEGPLLRVRYDKNYFMSLCHASGLTPIHFFHRHIKRTGQSVVVLKKEEA